MIICSFYTNEKYKLLAERMKESAEKLGLKVSLYEYPDVSSWSAALKLKATFIKTVMEEHNESILYLDADTWVERVPEELIKPGDFDIALCYLLPQHPLGCTLFFRNNAKSKVFVARWVEMFDLYPGTKLDETLFQYAVRELKGQVIVKHLPPAYGWMKYMEGRFPRALPVIHHLGAGEGSDKMAVWAEPGSPYKDSVPK